MPVTTPGRPSRSDSREERPPLYARRPFLAGLVRQLPLLITLSAVGAGLLVVAGGHWRRGLVVIGLSLVGTAVARLVLPVRRVGFLAVRSRPFDVLLLSGTGLALTVIALSLPGG
ncbi:DUF3017 domain-containing protein [Geodermatophilus sp. YIM 151500]|uniref:DUF3017 domain-containing protein n=1 Tax=Geodermatophilus sp. YIM 151500 TaxID=2984531 RepID=UPI0021E4311D|nr:DUF3017 domain-containing protein [Geodermatophilus sp. YIM 151500]MCV2488486.1 DUF3017 domain-containing protein [Geodermatophilus sp. YIM 151500]